MWVRSLLNDDIETDGPYGLERWSYALYPSWASYYTWSFQAASNTTAERDRVVIQAGAPVPVKLETSLQDFLRLTLLTLFEVQIGSIFTGLPTHGGD
jgi:hypothetical protein